MKVSVVTSVYNGERGLESTVESVLAQTMRDFEFIIVDDGSTDDTPKILDRIAKCERRIRVIRQHNQGLTRALSVGCRYARGQYIARQDVGDRSLPERLEKQSRYLDQHSEVVAVGAGARKVGPRGEFLGQSMRRLSPDQVTECFLTKGTSISHTVAMYRRDVYEKVGGYRCSFRFAQDIDLWYRMSSRGLIAELPDVLFEWGIDLDGISSSNNDRQEMLADLARQSWERLNEGEDDGEVLKQAEEVSWAANMVPSSVRRQSTLAGAEFFIGSQLYSLGDERCRDYLKRAIRYRPLWLRPWAKLALSYLIKARYES